MKKIYLAVPYSGIKESSYNQVTRAAAIIISEKGYNVFSPVTLSHEFSKFDDLNIPSTWDYWCEVDYQYIDWCDEVWILVPKEGREYIVNSIGVQAEIKYAKENDKRIRWIKVIDNTFKFL